MAPAASVSGAGPDESNRLARDVARVLDECRVSLAVHPRKLRELAALRSSTSSGGRFPPAFCIATTPLFDIARRSASTDRAARFVAAFASASASAGGGGDGFLEGFLRFLVAASAAAHRPARFRACQIISEVSKENLVVVFFFIFKAYDVGVLFSIFSEF
jgi:condensin complex subunit 3